MSRSNATVSSRPVEQPRSLDWIGPVIIAALVAVAMVALAQPVEGPEFVPRVTVTNPSAVPVDIDVSSDGEHWTPILAAEPNASTAARDVVNQGEDWIFRFRVAGTTVGTVPRTDDELTRANWRLEMPQRILNQIAIR